MRFVGKRLILRLNRELTDKEISNLNQKFADICVNSTIEKVEITSQESSDQDCLDKFRVSFQFARRDFGRLRELIDAINQK